MSLQISASCAGASRPEELIEAAMASGYQALAITDECSLAGIVRAWTPVRNKQQSGHSLFKLIIGSEFALDDGFKLMFWLKTLLATAACAP